MAATPSATQPATRAASAAPNAWGLATVLGVPEAKPRLFAFLQQKKLP